MNPAPRRRFPWTADEQAFAAAVQVTTKAEETTGLAVKLKPFRPPAEAPKIGGSDDVGDVSWAVPTITVNYPPNIPGLPGHSWQNAISMALFRPAMRGSTMAQHPTYLEQLGVKWPTLEKAK